MIRSSKYNISKFFQNRYSPVKFNSNKISDTDLMTILEAASTAPSSYNVQPWRFVLSSKDKFIDLLAEGNKTWAKEVETFVLVCADTLNLEQYRDRVKYNSKAEFDTGCAWGYMTMQAFELGISMHAIGGFDVEKSKVVFSLPSDTKPICIVALGYADEAESFTPRINIENLITRA